MYSLTCTLSLLLHKLIQIYIFLMIVYALASWLPSIRGRWLDYVSMAIDPVLTPVRRIIPPIGGIDLSFLVVIIFLQWLATAVVPSACIVTHAFL